MNSFFGRFWQAKMKKRSKLLNPRAAACAAAPVLCACNRAEEDVGPVPRLRGAPLTYGPLYPCRVGRGRDRSGAAISTVKTAPLNPADHGRWGCRRDTCKPQGRGGQGRTVCPDSLWSLWYRTGQVRSAQPVCSSSDSLPRTPAEDG